MTEGLRQTHWPILDSIGFLRCDCSRAAEAFVNWQNGIYNERGVEFRRSSFEGSLDLVVKRLLPLTSVETRRHLFIPTRSDWTAFIDNGHQGTDTLPPISYLAGALSCDGIGATHVPEGLKQYPATMFEMYGPADTDFLNIVRSVALGYDGHSWEFSTGGSPQSFEEPHRYASRKVKDRFSHDMLDRYLQHFGIEMFDEGFFCPPGHATTLVEKIGPALPASQEFELADAQNLHG